MSDGTLTSALKERWHSNECLVQLWEKLVCQILRGDIARIQSMNVVVRNTFLHLSKVEEKTPELARSSSAPPTCRKAAFDDEDCDSASVSTRCQTLRTAVLSSLDDMDDRLSQTTNSERGGTSSPTPSHAEGQSLTSSDVKLCGDDAELTEKTRQIEEMSQRVMDIWSKLQSVETQASTTTSAASPHSDGAVVPSNTWAWMPVQFAPQWTPAYVGFAQQKLDVKAPSFTPSCKPCGDAHDVLDSVKQLLTFAAGVASVEIQESSAEGTLATVAIKIDSNVSTIERVISTSQLVLLEAAANSQTIYVMGYEAEPFKELNESTFVTMLASLPAAWNRTACWETYSMGTCPRGKSCKWQHPGKRELQPVRFNVS